MVTTRDVFFSGDDVFVNLPTGYGKSLIFQMAPLVHAWNYENFSSNCLKKDPIILIVSPLLAWMQDQVKKLVSLGLRARANYSSGNQRSKDYVHV